jgi:hypothetical protein
MNTPAAFKVVSLASLLSHSTHDAAPEALSASAVERELVWFFGFAESEMGIRSNLLPTRDVALTHATGLLEDVDDDELQRRVDASHAMRIIERRLEAIHVRHVGILSAAYEPIAWPKPLRDLGPLAGIAMRLWAARNGRRIPEGHERQVGVWLEARLRTESGKTELARAVEEAKALYAEAMSAYANVRGVGASVVPEGER